MRHPATVGTLLSILVSLAGCSFPPASQVRDSVRPAQTYEITVDFYSSEPKQQPKDTSVLKEATGPLAIVSGVTRPSRCSASRRRTWPIGSSSV